MASKRWIAKNKKRKKLVTLYRERREELRKMIRDPNVDMEQTAEAVRMLNKMPRDSSPVRIRNRCNLSGRSRGYYRKFGLSRIALRDLALRGELPGVTKSSW